MCASAQSQRRDGVIVQAGLIACILSAATEVRPPGKGLTHCGGKRAARQDQVGPDAEVTPLKAATHPFAQHSLCQAAEWSPVDTPGVCCTTVTLYNCTWGAARSQDVAA